MIDAKILSACIASREAYQTVSPHLSGEEMGPQSAKWWELIQQWYKRDATATGVDLDLLVERGKRELPEKHRELLVDWLRELPEAPSPANVVAEVLDLKRHNLGNELAESVLLGTPDLSLMHRYEKLLEATSLEVETVAHAYTYTNDDAEQIAILDRQGAIKIAPGLLNERLGGGAIAGDHIIVAARPDAGKTLFAVNAVAGFCRQKLHTVYFGNEENTYKTRRRLCCSLTGATYSQYDKQPQRVIDAARQRGLDLVTFVRMTPGTLDSVEEVVAKHSPDVFVVDQLRGLGGNRGGDKLTTTLEHNATAVRNMAGKYGAVALSLTQAGETADNKQFPSMGDVSDSKTGIQGACDSLVMIGFREDQRMSGYRGISIPKNKLGGVVQGFSVQFDMQRSRIK